MNKNKFFLIGFAAILIFAFLIRIIPALGNNFYFTMDQGNDAVHVREILSRHQILLQGPETGIEGLFAGPLWYYFISIGYAIFGGHPFGSVFMLILLNVALTGILMQKISKEVSHPWALLVGASIQISWWFYDTSRYGFNPFPLVFLSFMLIIFLVDFVSGKNKSYLFAAIFIGLGFNTEIAGTIALTIFYLLVGLWFVIKKYRPSKYLVFGILIIGAFLLPYVITETTSGFSQIHTLVKAIGNPHGIFSERNFDILTPHFLKVVSRSTLRQIPEIGILIFTIIIFLVGKKWKTGKEANKFIERFVLLSIALLIVSWLWFSSNTGWQSWHTVYISPLIFICVLLLIHELKKEIAFLIFTISLVSHLLIFKDRYWEYIKPTSDPSILVNEIGAIDWVYQKAEGEGFYVYNYLPSVYDYPYQYLFWWHGLKKYGYLPCEYSSFPDSPGIFIPGKRYYQEPQKICSSLRFLIVEPNENSFLRNQWLEELHQGSQLLEETTIGKIKIEKRIILSKAQQAL